MRLFPAPVMLDEKSGPDRCSRIRDSSCLLNFDCSGSAIAGAKTSDGACRSDVRGPIRSHRQRHRSSAQNRSARRSCSCTGHWANIVLHARRAFVHLRHHFLIQRLVPACLSRVSDVTIALAPLRPGLYDRVQITSHRRRVRLVARYALQCENPSSIALAFDETVQNQR